MRSGSAVYFLSDAHLGAEPREREREREARLHGFLASLAGEASALYILGDLFDFWFEYRHAIPRRHFATLAVLRNLRQAGVEIHYLNGNHDFWLGPFLSEDLGIHTHQDALALRLQGRRIWLHHGDGLIRGDLGYRILKRVLRHPVSVALYRLLHPDIGFPLARRVSHVSRGSRGKPLPDGDLLWRQVAAPRFAEGFDAVLIGHLHHAIERREGDRVFFVLGDWIRTFTFATLRDGQFALHSWPA